MPTTEVHHRYAEVVLFKAAGAFDAPLPYSIPDALAPRIHEGALVTVPLRKALRQGVVTGFLEVLPEGISAGSVKAIAAVHSEFSLPFAVVTLARGLSERYRCSLLRALNLMLPKKVREGRFKVPEADLYTPPDLKLFSRPDFEKILTEEQALALEKIRSADRPVVLFGVTGSGKTELYLRLAHEAIMKGRQAMILLPEIALTPQTIGYFRHLFGAHLAVFHSRLSEGARATEWWKVKTGFAPLIIGSRSAVFAPADRLGLIVMDEEHEWTYKQESAPYYETHWVAETLAKASGATLILASATPRLESYYRARTGEFALVEMKGRPGGAALPTVTVADLREEFCKGNFSPLSLALQNELRAVLARGEQAILFVNRRGAARAVTCRDCGHTLLCAHCDIALTFHRAERGRPDRLLCHLCHAAMPPPLLCPACRSAHIRHLGIGTQRVEEEVKKLFPAARVVRADRDTTATAEGFEPLYRDFLAGQYDVLVGTQMVAKGLDFPRVTLIGIVLADLGLNLPDFRAHERVFQLTSQVAGRAGRADAPGRVILQTYQPDHFAIRKAAENDYTGFMERELEYRRKFGYPPFSRLVKCTAVGKSEAALEACVRREAEVLEDAALAGAADFKVTTAPAAVPKKSDLYHYHLLVRLADPRTLFERWSPPKGWRLDVDPAHL